MSINEIAVVHTRRAVRPGWEASVAARAGRAVARSSAVASRRGGNPVI
ncbi:hypothetical protein ACFQZ4_46590 [Catellatospora coxensis]